MGHDAMSRAVRKKLDAARRLADPGREILAYGSGVGQARMAKGAVGLAAGFAVVFLVVLVALHTVLIPGFLLVLMVIRLIRPKRGLALTNGAVLVFHESMWNGRPSHLIMSAPAPAFVPSDAAGTGGSRVFLHLGPERVTLKGKEYERLLRAVKRPGAELPAAG
jgi:hypothetical protein